MDIEPERPARADCEPSRPGTPAAQRRPPHILTTYRKGNLLAWLERVDLTVDWHAEIARTWKKPVTPLYELRRDVKFSWRLFRRSRRYDAVVTGSDRMSRLFAILQLILRRKRVPHLYIDWLCNPVGGPVKRWVQRAALRWAVLSGSFAIVQGRKEIGAYARELGVPESKFVFLPYHSTLADFAGEVTAGQYIFAGGDTNRDYRTLIEAVRGLGYRAVIAAIFREHFKGVSIPPNVEVVTLSQGDFLRTMAGAALVVVPMLPKMLHAGGQQTWINAMTLGKAVIVAEDRSASDYIVHGSTGWLVPPGDVPALRDAIRNLMENPNLARNIGENARKAARAFTPERFCENVLRLVEECVR